MLIEKLINLEGIIQVFLMLSESLMRVITG